MRDIKHSLFAGLFMIGSSVGMAQKLPKVQASSVRAPADIKIDGKPTEWGKFQAYNNATGIYYTLSNDDNNLYLAVQAKDPEIINRIIGGGLTLSVQHSPDKNDKNKQTITYPVIDYGTAFSIMLRSPQGADTTRKAADSIMTLHNRMLAEKCKWIGIKNIEGVDTLISIYNQDGIKAVGLFDNKKIYTFEIALLLKHFRLSADHGEKFTYNIKINGVKKLDQLFGEVTGDPGAVARFIQSHNESDARQSASTDFLGKYQLANK